jgi:para-aminobenzoate synthetase component 1
MTSGRTFTTFPIDNIELCKRQLLSWANRSGNCCFLDNNGYDMPGHLLECIAGVGCLASLRAQAGNAFTALHDFHALHGDWIFGHLGYDLGGELEAPGAGLPDPAGFPDLFFFIPRYVFLLSGNSLRVGTRGEPAGVIWDQIRGEAAPGSAPVSGPVPVSRASAAPPPVSGEVRATAVGKPSRLRSRFSKAAYLETVSRLQKHISRGDCYEITFCQEFFQEDTRIDPLPVYRRLTALSPNPSSAYYTFDGFYLLCASPERYLQHRQGRLLSQPIKGTARRWPEDPVRDQEQKEALFTSAKERSENVMIVDLVRNDLSRVCAEGSVRVDELWGVYAFPQVFQLISSVSGLLEPGQTWLDALKATFPMGSMTGAPKKRAMELIGRYERTKRGIYSGAVGYVDPEGNFDFNVVIRSILYNAPGHYLSFPAGSAITAASDPAKEYAECLLKAGAMKKALAAIPAPSAFEDV